eukprot:SAG11_NODE_899_length_6643_cov_55.347048_6_plen_71_part_00
MYLDKHSRRSTSTSVLDLNLVVDLPGTKFTRSTSVLNLVLHYCTSCTWVDLQLYITLQLSHTKFSRDVDT